MREDRVPCKKRQHNTHYVLVKITAVNVYNNMDDDMSE